MLLTAPQHQQWECESPAGSLSLAMTTRYVPGSPATVLFVHGLGCVKESFSQAFHAPSLRTYSLVACDFPGHGLSPMLEGFEATIPGLGQVTAAIANQQASPIILVGHSMGGSAAVLAGPDIPALAGVINIEGNLVGPDSSTVSRRISHQTEAEFLESGYREFIKSLKAANRADFTTWVTWLHKADPKAIYGYACSLVEWSDNGKLLDTFLTLPHRTYMYGEKSLRPELTLLLADTPMVGIPDSGHFPMLDNPQSFNETLATIVRSLFEV